MLFPVVWSYLVEVIALCSNNSALPRTPVELRALVASGSSGGAKIVRPQIHKLGQRLGEERCAEIAQRYEAGETAQVLADEFGVARSSLVSMLRARHVVVRRRALSAQQIGALCSAYETGTTIAALEASTGIPHGSIQRALKSAGVEMRPRGFQSPSSRSQLPEPSSFRTQY